MNQDSRLCIEPRKMYGCGPLRITLSLGERGKSTGCIFWKTAFLSPLEQGIRTPPGSETRACSQRGSLGTRETRMSPKIQNGREDTEMIKLLVVNLCSSQLRNAPKSTGAFKVPGADSEERTNPGRTFGSLSGS